MLAVLSEGVDRWPEALEAELLVPNATRLAAWRVSCAVNSNRCHKADATAPHQTPPLPP